MLPIRLHCVHSDNFLLLPLLTLIIYCYSDCMINTLWPYDADLRLYITTVQDG